MDGAEVHYSNIIEQTQAIKHSSRHLFKSTHVKMPKLPNAKKMASRAVRQEAALDSALSGKYEIALVEKSLGRSQFNVLIGKTPRTVAVTSAVLRCGPNGGSYITAGSYVIVEGTEVLGVVAANSKGFKALRKAGRIPEERSADPFDDLFDASEGAKEDIWARTDAAREERVALADELAARYRRRNAGLASKGKEVVLDSTVEEVEVEAEVEEVPAEETEEQKEARESRAAGGLNRKERRALAALQEAEAAARAEEAARLAEIAAIYRRAEEEEAAEVVAERLAAARRSWVATKSWEEEADEIDIDAI